MAAQFRYCSHCGAANPVGSAECFACQHPLTSTTEQTRETLLHERYRLLTQVGAGGFGGVYRALDTVESSQIVAIKQIRLRGLTPQEMIEATDGFHREVRLLSNLAHPSLPRIRDTFTDPEHWYVVMDFIEGETLENYLKRHARPALPLKEALALGIQLCTVLEYLHSREPAIIFRDLKPSNVMRTEDGRVYLIDFGIARRFIPGQARDTMPFGSPGYAAPEQYGRAQTTPQADLYSLGALLHHTLTSLDPAESPFRFAPLLFAGSGELAELDALIQRMVATEPGERPASAAEVRAILQRQAESIRRREWQMELATAPRPQPPFVPTAQSGLSRRTLFRNLATAGITIVGIGSVAALCTTVANLHPGVHGVHGVAVQPPPSPGIPEKHFIYRGHNAAITALSWSPDGLYVASGSADKTVHVWRAADGALRYVLVGYDMPVTSITWATDRTNVIASSGMSDGTVQVWDALRDHRDLIYHGDGRVLGLSWQYKTPWIASGGTDNAIYTWSADTGQKGTSYSGHKGDVRTLAWLPRFSSASFVSQDTPTPTPPSTPSPGALLPGNHIASGGADGTVQIWDAQTGQHITTSTGHQASVNSLAVVYEEPTDQFQTNDPMLVSASDDGTARVWHASGEPGRMYKGHQGPVNSVAVCLTHNFAYYDQCVVSGGEDHTVQVWGIYNLQRMNLYREHQSPVRAVATSPIWNDTRVVSGDADGLVHLWSITPGLYH